VVEVAMFSPPLEGYARWLEARVTAAPIRVRTTATFREEELLPLLPDAEIVLTSHWSVALGEAARSLRFIQMPGAGWDKIDPAGIPAGVLVANCYEHEQGIAEWVLMMCLALSRKLLEADRTIRMGVWRLFPAMGHPPYKELGDQTIGIVGLGRIGRAVARLAGAFGMRRIGVDALPISDDTRTSLGLDAVWDVSELDRLLAESDFVVVAVPFDESTRGLFDARRLRQLKPTAFLINPARAEICDERDLYAALRDRLFAGAALDPWWHYPHAGEVVAPSAYPYQELDNVIMSPHASGSTEQTFRRRMEVCAANIDRFLRGEPVVNVVSALSRGDGNWQPR
jgi:phosphoglycerate dehydrogenase-like enzyme